MIYAFATKQREQLALPAARPTTPPTTPTVTPTYEEAQRRVRPPRPATTFAVDTAIDWARSRINLIFEAVDVRLEALAKATDTKLVLNAWEKHGYVLGHNGTVLTGRAAERLIATLYPTEKKDEAQTPGSGRPRPPAKSRAQFKDVRIGQEFESVAGRKYRKLFGSSSNARALPPSSGPDFMTFHPDASVWLLSS